MRIFAAHSTVVSIPVKITFSQDFWLYFPENSVAFIKSNIASKQILSKRTGNIFCTIICERRVVFLCFLVVQLYLYLRCSAACGTGKWYYVEQAYKQTWTLFYKQALHNRNNTGFGAGVKTDNLLAMLSLPQRNTFLLDNINPERLNFKIKYMDSFTLEINIGS